MALTKVTGQVIKNTTDVTVGVLTVTNNLSVDSALSVGATATFVSDVSIGGTVSIAGTLTYEDVTNIDAVGLITARNGIIVGSGITLSKDGDIFTTGISTFRDDVTIISGSLNVINGSSNDGINVRVANNDVGILSSTDDGANLLLLDDDSESKIRTVDGRLHLHADVRDAVADSAIRFYVDNNVKAHIDANGHFYFDSDSDSYFHKPASNTFAFKTAGQERLRILSTGQVGIGTTISSVTSSATGVLIVDGGDSNIGAIQVHAGDGENIGDLAGISFSHGQTGTIGRPKAAIALEKQDLVSGRGDLCFYVDKASNNNPVSTTDEVVRITNNGDVGIGTTMSGSGTRKLHIYKGSCGAHGQADGELVVESNNAPTLQLLCPSTKVPAILFGDESNSSAGRIQYSHPDNAMIFKTNGNTERVRIESNGRVGIGTSSSDGNLHIFNGSPANPVTAAGDSNELVLESAANVGMSLLTANNSYGRIKFGDPDANNAGVIFYYHTDDHMGFKTANTEALSINSSGNIGINQLTPTNAKMHVVSATGVTTSIVAKFRNPQSTADVESRIALVAGYPDVGSDTEGHAFIGAKRNGAGNQPHITFSTFYNSEVRERVRITNSGKVRIGGENLAGVESGQISYLHVQGQNTSGDTATIQTWRGTSDVLELIEDSGGDFALSVDGQDNRLQIKDGTGGILFNYANNDVSTFGLNNGYVFSRKINDDTTTNAANINIVGSASGYRIRKSTSTRRFKDNIREYNGGGVSSIKRITPKLWEDHADGFTKLGFIAEELHEMGLTNAVTYDGYEGGIEVGIGVTYGDGYGNGTPPVTKTGEELEDGVEVVDGLDLTALVAELVIAVKELSTRVETLESGG